MRALARPRRRAGRRRPHAVGVSRASSSDRRLDPRARRPARRRRPRRCDRRRRSTCASCSTTCTTSVTAAPGSACSPRWSPRSRPTPTSCWPAGCSPTCRSPGCGPPTRSSSSPRTISRSGSARSSASRPASAARHRRLRCSAAGRRSCGSRSRRAPAWPSATPARRCSPTSRRAIAGRCSRWRRSARRTPSSSSRIVGEPADLERLATSVPMVRALDADRFEAHDLWLDALARSVDPDEARSIRARARRRAARRRPGRPGRRRRDRGGRRAGARRPPRWRSSARRSACCRSSWRGGGSTRQPVWRRRRSCACSTRRGGRRSTSPTGRSTHDLDAIADELRARHDAAGEVTALAVGTVAAQARGDTDRLVALALRTAGVPAAGDHPVVRLATCSIAAVVAEMHGDPERAVEEFAALSRDGLPVALSVSANRFLMHCLLLAGRADEAVAIADRVPAATGQRALPDDARVRPLAGRRPVGLRGVRATRRRRRQRPRRLRRPRVPRRDRRQPRRARRVRGRPLRARQPPRRRRPRQRPRRPRGAPPRRAGGGAGHRRRRTRRTRAMRSPTATSAGSSPSGTSSIRCGAPAGTPPISARRTTGRAASPGSSSTCASGPIARLVPLDPDHVLTVLPLPWSVELACRLHDRGAADGRRLCEALLDAVGCRAHAELRAQATATDPRVAAGASALLALHPSRAGRRRVDRCARPVARAAR